MGVELRAKRPETTGLRIDNETMERAKENLNKRPDDKILQKRQKVKARKEFKRNLKLINQQHKLLEENGPSHVKIHADVGKKELQMQAKSLRKQSTAKNDETLRTVKDPRSSATIRRRANKHTTAGAKFQQEMMRYKQRKGFQTQEKIVNQSKLNNTKFGSRISEESINLSTVSSRTKQERNQIIQKLMEDTKQKKLSSKASSSRRSSIQGRVEIMTPIDTVARKSFTRRASFNNLNVGNVKFQSRNSIDDFN